MMEEECPTDLDVCLGCGSITVKGDHCTISNSKSVLPALSIKDRF